MPDLAPEPPALRPLPVAIAIVAVMCVTALAHYSSELPGPLLDTLDPLPSDRSTVDALDRLGSRGRTIYGTRILPIDFIFPAAYAALLLAAIRAMRRLVGRRVGMWAMAPLGAMAADYLENGLAAAALLRYPDSLGRSEELLRSATGLKWLFLVLTVLVLLRLAVPAIRELSRRYYVGEYLFFLRAPVVCGAIFVALPVVGPTLAPSSLTNLFVMRGWGVAVVSLVGVLVAWVIVYTARLTWVSAPTYCALPFRRNAEPEEPPLALLDGTWFWLGPLLTLPLATKLVLAGESPFPWSVLAVGVGFAVAWLLRLGSVGFTRSWTRWLAREGAEHGLLRRFVVSGRIRSKGLAELHWRAAWFFAVTAVVYVICGALTHPIVPFASRFPALLYVLLLLMLAAWTFGQLSFRFDVHRIPATFVAVVAVLLWQAVWPSGHVYPTYSWSEDPPASTSRYLAGWNATRSSRAPDEGRTPMVVVAASGGGITASAWTARVLVGLEQEIPEFSESVALISSVSGGGLGAMYYVDAFDGGRLLPDASAEVVRSAEASSLTSVGWGLAYPDLVRVALGRAMGRFDRGWAQEKRWRQHLSRDESTLSDWSRDVSGFRRPLQLFNVTLQETGEQMLLGPAVLGNVATEEEPGRHAPRDLGALLRRGDELRDIRVSTAARLSATFPYVTPPARPLDVDASRAFHSADGGYYDNSGLTAAVRILDGYLASAVEGDDRPSCILLLEIRASGLPTDEGVEPRRGGILNTLYGPLETLYNVRSASQLERNLFEIRQAAELWRRTHRVEVLHHSFVLSDDLPLSWHLSAAQKQRIADHWVDAPEPDADEDRELHRPWAHNRETLAALLRLWNGQGCEG